MTRYNYVSEMQQLCFRAVQALNVLKEEGLRDFYNAAEIGFAKQMDDLNSSSFDEASKEISERRLTAYYSTKEFVDDKEYEAACLLKEQQQEAKHA